MSWFKNINTGEGRKAPPSEVPVEEPSTVERPSPFKHINTRDVGTDASEVPTEEDTAASENATPKRPTWEHRDTQSGI